MYNGGISLTDLPWMQDRTRSIASRPHRGSVLIMAVIVAETTGGTDHLGVVETMQTRWR